MSPRTKHNLSPARRRLVELMSETQFGHIDKLVIRAGEPVFEPMPSITRELKFGGDPERAPACTSGEFTLKRHVVEFFEQLDRMRDGVIDRLEIKHDVPFRAFIGADITA